MSACSRAGVVRTAGPLLALVLAGWMGCGQDPAMELAATDRESAVPIAPSTILEGTDEGNTAIRLTREAPAPDGQGTNEDWAKRHVDEISADVLFPRWQARRRAAGKYEVMFTYTVVEGGTMTKRGCAWTADVVLKLVSPRREMTPEELMSRASRVYRRRRMEQQRIELIPE